MCLVFISNVVEAKTWAMSKHKRLSVRSKMPLSQQPLPEAWCQAALWPQQRGAEDPVGLEREQAGAVLARS